MVKQAVSIKTGGGGRHGKLLSQAPLAFRWLQSGNVFDIIFMIMWRSSVGAMAVMGSRKRISTRE